MKQHIWIVLVNWNNTADTLRCLGSLEQMNLKKHDVTVLVVDNNSTDVSALIKYTQPITLLRLPENIGFTGANNVGIKKAQEANADYVWLLNNDTLLANDALDRLLETFDDPSVGIAGSKIYFMKGREYHKYRYKKSELGNVLWYAGGLIDWDNVYGSHRGVDEVDTGQYDTLEETAFVTGCSMMISKECIATVGLLDDKYFAFLEDLDYCLRAKQAGYKVVYNPESKVWHKNAGATGGAGNTIHQYYMTRNRLLFGMRYANVRTKLALVREAFYLARFGSTVQKRAIIDAAMGKWGKQ